MIFSVSFRYNFCLFLIITTGCFNIVTGSVDKVKGLHHDQDEAAEVSSERVTYEANINHYLNIAQSLKSSVADQTEEISTMKNQIQTISQQIETCDKHISVVDVNLTERIKQLERKISVIRKDSEASNDDGNIYKCKVPRNSSEDQLNEISKELLTNVTWILQQIRIMARQITKLEQKTEQIEKKDNLADAFKGIDIKIAKSPYSNKLFMFPMNNQASFSEATKFCEQRGTTLVSIHSSGENKFVEDWLSTHYKVYSHFWLGHERPNTERSGWHDGSSLDYTNWGPVDNAGRPNPSGCLFMCHYCGSSINGWYIRPCNDHFNFLCQKILP